MGVQKVGLAIYLFSLVFGIYFSTKATMERRSTKSDIVSVLLVDDNTTEDQDTKSKKKFGSRLFNEEDDDDSAREFYCEPLTIRRFAGYAPLKPIEGYTSNPINTNTPPPWC